MKEGKVSIMTSIVGDIIFYITNANEHMQKSWVNGKYYEQKMLEFIKRNYSNNTMIDIGSCIGNHTVFFSKIADKVFSFEPDFDNFFQQSMNIKLNNINNTVLYNIAIGEKNKVSKFNKAEPYNIGGGGIIDTGEHLVPVVKLDDFEIENVVLMKIDVEGYETNVLNGAKKTIKKYLPDLFIECHSTIDRQNMLYILQKINKNYTIYKQVFNNTPTYLFTLRKEDEFK